MTCRCLCVNMLNMKKASIREIQHNFKAVLEYLKHGEEVFITKRNRIIAKITPEMETERGENDFPDFLARAQRIFPEVKGKAVSSIIEDDRRERH